MGVICSNSNKPKRVSNTIHESREQEQYKFDEFNSRKFSNETNNFFTINNKNFNKVQILEEVKFYIDTLDKNDYFLTSNFENLKYFSFIKKYYSKWEEILNYTRRQKKFFYRNLNQNHNFTISNNIRRNGFYKVSNNINNNQDEINLNKLDEIYKLNNLNDKNHDLIKSSIGRGSEIFNYVGKNLNNSDLIQKFQIAFCFNKYRFIKYLSKGPPNNIRWNIWISLALSQSENDFLSQDKYLELKNKDDKNFEIYEEEQIRKDLNRSNQNKEFFSNEKTINSLYNILKALAIDDPELGYCQGMNILAANFLMISDENEYETFNMLRFLFKHLELREFFINGFPLLMMFIFILKEFIKDNHPKLFAKINELEVPEEIWIFKWLQTLFNLTLPLSITIRLIDCILCFGLEFLLNYSLAFIKFFEKKLFICEDINDFLNTFNVEKLINPNILVNNILYSSSNKNSNNKKNNKCMEEETTYLNNLEKINYFKDSSCNLTLNNNNNLDKNENTFKILNIYAYNTKINYENNNQSQSQNQNKIIRKETLKESDNINKKDTINNKTIKEHNTKNSDEIEKNKIFSPLKSNNDDKKSDLITTLNTSIKYMINTKDELLSFRETLITNAKKIDLKDAIKNMIENYTRENVENKNKFNDNDSSTGDGINEEKTVVYHNENFNNNNNNNEENNNKKISNKTPFEISYKNVDSVSITKCNLKNNNINENFGKINTNSDFKDNKQLFERLSLRRISKNSLIDDKKDMIIEENENYKTCIVRNDNNNELKNGIMNSNKKEKDISNNFYYKNICSSNFLKSVNKSNDSSFINHINTFRNTGISNAINKSPEAKQKNFPLCNNFKDELDKSNLTQLQAQKNKFKENINSNNNYIKEVEDPYEKNLEEDFYLNYNIIDYFNKENYSQNQNENPFKKVSKNDLKLNELSESTDRNYYMVNNNDSYSCKNIYGFLKRNSIILKNKHFNDLFLNNNFSPNNKGIYEYNYNKNKSQSTTKNKPSKNSFFFNFNNNPFSELSRFSLENSNNPNINYSRVLTVDQISMMNNIKEKLDVIKNFDYFDIEENEDDDLYINVDEDFDYDIESEKRSKIDRNINDDRFIIKRFSQLSNEDKVIRFQSYFEKDRANINNEIKINSINQNKKTTENLNKYKINEYENCKINKLNLENEKELNLEENSFYKNDLISLYGDSYNESNDTLNNCYINKIKVNKNKNSSIQSLNNSNTSSIVINNFEKNNLN